MLPRSDRPTFSAPKDRPERVPGKLVIKFAPGAVRPHVERGASAAARARAIPTEVVEPLEFLRASAGLTSLEPLFAEAPAARRARAAATGEDSLRLAVAASAEGDEDVAGLAVATLSEDAVTGDQRRAVEAAPSVEWVESLPVRWAAAAPGIDPMRNLQWGLRAIRWFEAARPAEADVVVGIMDTGIDRNHPEFEAVDVTYEHAGHSATDIVGHGTHVAGIVAASVNNAIGIAGVASCQLVMWKIFDDEPADDGEYYVDTPGYWNALRAAGSTGIAALNLSIGGSAASRTEDLLLQRLIRGGVTVCAAMGNEFEVGNPTEYPGAFANVVSVGAIAETKRRASFSNTGRHIDLVAPGTNILSTLPRRRSDYREETDYAAWSGTSMATPHVAAAAALIADADPSADPAQIADRLRSTAAKLPAMGAKARTNEYGAGLLDLQAALS